MKHPIKLVIVILFIVMPRHVQGDTQFQYQYDASGNRVSRVLVVPTPALQSPHMPGHSGETTVSPTVTTDKVTITTSLDLERNHMSYTVSDLQGSVLAVGDITGQHTAVSFGQYSSGIYLLTVYSAQGNQGFKIVKQ